MVMNSENPVGGVCCPPSETAPKNDPIAGGVTVPPANVLRAPPPVKPAPPIPAAKTDFVFALLWSVLGYGFVHTVTTAWNPGLVIYVPLYAAAVLCYVYKSGLHPPKESWFWLAALLCIGLPLPFYSMFGHQFGILQLIALIGTAAYFTLCASGVLLSARTSSWLPLDILNALFVVPFGNFSNHLRVFTKGIRSTKPGRSILLVGLGLLIALPLLAIILPLLSGADQAFFYLLDGIRGQIEMDFLQTLIRIVLSLPVTAFLYGLVHGAIHRRRTAVYSKPSIYAAQKELHFMPDLAVITALCLVCFVYILFIGLQSSYLFSSFSGGLPEGFSHSESARQGFFELCQISGFNVFILLCVNILCKTPFEENKPLRILTISLSALSLLLIATAASKMGLYIAALGLTQLRVLTSVFMLWLAIVFVLIIVRQFRKLPLIRIAAFTGATLFCLLCVIDVNSCIASYNNAWGFVG